MRRNKDEVSNRLDSSFSIKIKRLNIFRGKKKLLWIFVIKFFYIISEKIVFFKQAPNPEFLPILDQDDRCALKFLWSWL